MRDEFESISLDDMQPSWSHRVGNAPRVATVGTVEAQQPSCWSQLPSELLREVLVKIESEGWWPARRDVVACAGWRGIMKEEVVRVPEASGKLAFPISLKQPGPKDGTIKCFIRRNRTTQTYSLYIGVTEDGARPSMKVSTYRRRLGSKSEVTQEEMSS